MATHKQEYIELFVHLSKGMSDFDIKNLLSEVFNINYNDIINFLENVDDPGSREYLMSIYTIDELSFTEKTSKDANIIYYRKTYNSGYELEISLEVEASVAKKSSISTNVKLANAISKITNLPVLFDDDSLSPNTWLKVEPDGKIYQVVGYDEDNYPGGWDEENSGIYLDESKTKFFRMFPLKHN